MGKLHTIQNQLLSDIFNRQPTSQFEARGIEVYRANLRATAARALQITFPTVAELIGEPLMSYAAEELLAFQPPAQGNWAVWGEKLPFLLSGLPALADYPFVPPVATLDYHCHQMVRAADVDVDFESLQLLNTHQPEELSIALNPQLILLASEFPLVAIRRAHQQPSELNTQALNEAMSDDAEQYYLACYRNGLEVLVEPLSKLEFDWLHALIEMSLGDALTAFKNTDFSFQQWLTSAIQTNLLHKIHVKNIGDK